MEDDKEKKVEETPLPELTLEQVLEENPEYATRVEEMIAARLEERENELNAQRQEEISRAERLAQMNEEERRVAELEEREAQLRARELEIERHTLRAEASKMLQERNLPTALADYVNYNSAEEIAGSVKTLGSLVEEEVSRRVKDIAKGSTVPGSGSAGDAREKSHKARNEKWEKRLNL